MVYRWDQAFEEYGDGTYFVGQKGDRRRGFHIFTDGTWATSYYVNDKQTLSTICRNKCVTYYFSNGDYFESLFDEENNSVATYVRYGGKTVLLEINFSTGEWNYYLANSPYRVQYDILLKGVVSYYNGLVDKAAKTASCNFEFKGLVKGPSKVAKPYRTHHQRSDTYEFIRSVDRYEEYRGVMMMGDNKGNKWYGECYKEKPGGFGISSFVYSNFTSFRYGIFESKSGGIPYLLKNSEYVAIQLLLGKTSEDNTSISISPGCNPNRNFTLYLKANGPKLAVYDGKGNAVYVDEYFNGYRLDTPNDKNTYPFYR